MEAMTFPQQLMQISVDGCLPAAGGRPCWDLLSAPSYATCLREALALWQLLTAAAEVAGEQNQASQLLWRTVMAWTTGGWGQHKAGTNPSAPVTSQGSSTTQPKNRNPHKAGYIHLGLDPKLCPHLSHPQPAWGITVLQLPISILALALADLSSEKSYFSCVFPHDDGRKV